MNSTALCMSFTPSVFWNPIRVPHAINIRTGAELYNTVDSSLPQMTHTRCISSHEERMKARGASPPAVHNHGAGVRGGAGLDPPYEGQQARGVEGDAVLRPGREVELPDFVLRRVASLLGTEIPQHRAARQHNTPPGTRHDRDTTGTPLGRPSAVSANQVCSR